MAPQIPKILLLIITLLSAINRRREDQNLTKKMVAVPIYKKNGRCPYLLKGDGDAGFDGLLLPALGEL